MRITREIGIDMGHRIPAHTSKCRNLHGHRYRIIATCEGGLFTEGSSEGMVVDFGFLKSIMMDHIDRLFDHGTSMWRSDPTLLHELGPLADGLREKAGQYGYVAHAEGWKWGKLVITADVPTAENLAKLWAHILRPHVERHLEGTDGRLYSVTVWETPNCSAIYKLPNHPLRWEGNDTARDLLDERV